MIAATPTIKRTKRYELSLSNEKRLIEVTNNKIQEKIANPESISQI